MRPEPDLSYRLGLLLADYEDFAEKCDDDFTIYDSFHDTGIHDKGFLRRMAAHRGKIDALEYLLHDEHPPDAESYDWFNTTDDATLLRNVTTTFKDAITERGGSGTTWTEYLHGWLYALRFALDAAERPWGSRCFRDPGAAHEFIDVAV